MKRTTVAITTLLALLLFTLAACPKVEKSASMALDNANSVLKTGEEKIWMEPEPGE